MKDKPDIKAVVNIYEWNENDKMNIKKFEGPSMDWLDMVMKCRSDMDFSHEYDIVCGKIVDDNVGETVSYKR